MTTEPKTYADTSGTYADNLTAEQIDKIIRDLRDIAKYSNIPVPITVAADCIAALERENAELRNAVEAMNLKALRAAHEPLQRRGDITIQLLRLLRPLAAWERANGSAVGLDAKQSKEIASIVSNWSLTHSSRQLVEILDVPSHETDGIRCDDSDGCPYKDNRCREYCFQKHHYQQPKNTGDNCGT